MKYLSPHTSFLSPAEAGLQEVDVMPGILPKLQQDLALQDRATIGQSNVSGKDFESLFSQLCGLIDDGYPLPHRTEVDGRDRNHAGYWKPPLKINDAGELVSDSTHAFHVSPFAIRRWRDRRGNSAGFVTFLDKSETALHGLMASVRSAIEDLEVDHPRLSKTFFPDNIGNRYGSDIGNPTLRLMIYESAGNLARAGLTSTQISNIPHGKPHLDRSAIGLLAWDSSNDVFAMRPDGNGGHQFEQMAYVEGRAHLFLGLGWTAMYQGQSRYQPLEHGMFRVTPADTEDRGTAAVVLMRPAFIDDSTSQIGQKLYTQEQLTELREQAVRVTQTH